MSLKNLLLPAAVLISVIAFLASHAQAQTMGEYATTTAGVGTGGGSMGTGFSIPSIPGSNGGGSQTWGVSGTGSSWSDRAGAASRSGGDFASRAGSMSSGASAQSRWPDTGLSNRQGFSFSKSKLDEGEDRFSASDRFPSHDFSSTNRWPASSLSDSKSGLDTSYNSVSGD